MADITKLKDLIEAYGIGVRAGVITPCLQDENAFRLKLGLEPAPESVVSDWDDSDGVRRPITLQRPSMAEEPKAIATDEAAIDPQEGKELDEQKQV